MKADDPSRCEPPRRPEGAGRYCRQCHYPLQGLDSPGRCPECGCDFDFRHIYSYTFEDRPPTLIERTLSRRALALVAALALEAFAIWAVQGGVCGLTLIFPGWVFAMVWLLMVVASVDLHAEELWQFMVFGAAAGLVIFLPFCWIVNWSVVLVGLVGGSISGVYLHHLKVTHWIG